MKQVLFPAIGFFGGGFLGIVFIALLWNIFIPTPSSENALTDTSPAFYTLALIFGAIIGCGVGLMTGLFLAAKSSSDPINDEITEEDVSQ